MNEELIEKQTKQLVAHMNDYQNANQLHKKGEAAIYDKHRIGDRQFGPGLNDELNAYRQKKDEEWGIDGWRNKQFVKQQVDEAQRPTEAQVQDMHKGQQVMAENKSTVTEREEFLEGLKENAAKQTAKGPKPR